MALSKVQEEINFYLFEGAYPRPTIVSPTLEAIKLIHERKDSLGKRVLIKMLGMFAYLPKLTFEEEDIDKAASEKMLKYPKLLDDIDSWISYPDPQLLSKLEEARRILSGIQAPGTYPVLYRGFNPKSVEQDTMGLQRMGWFGPKPASFKPGDKFSYVPVRPLSFTHHEGTASGFGNVIVSINPAKYKASLLDLSMELCYAIFEKTLREDPSWKRPPYYTTYGEFILLPNKKPVEFQVVSINNKK
jgi:hypothetical protein